MYFKTFYNLHAKNVFVADSAKENVTQLGWTHSQQMSGAITIMGSCRCILEDSFVDIIIRWLNYIKASS